MNDFPSDIVWPGAEAPAPAPDIPHDVIWPDGGKSAQPRSTVASVAAQVPTGFNEGLATVAGAPVDVTTWLLNRIPGVEIKKPFGGSESIKSAMGYIGANPDDMPARTTAEKIARGVGGGAAMMVAPEAALASAGRAGVQMAPRVAETLKGLFGPAESVGEVATNAAIGGTAGGTGKAAEIAAPEPYKPIAEMAGNLVGGGGAILAATGARGAAALAGGAKEYIAPMTEAGRERTAGGILQDRATNPSAVRETLEGGSAEIVLGSKPTTFQQTGDMGIGALEREVATANPADFNQRRADQNIARTSAVTGLQESGSPADVSNLLRGQLRALDTETDRTFGLATTRAQEATAAIGGTRPPEAYGADIQARLQPPADAATQAARDATQALGGAGVPEEYGGALRATLGAARIEAKRRERALWDAVDPDRSLTLPADRLRTAADSIESQMTASARPIGGEERAILDVINQYPSVMPFRDITDLRSRISTAMREELRTAGETPTYGRLSRLRGAVEGVVSDAVEGRVAADTQALSRGEIAPDQTLAARLQSQVDAWREQRQSAGRANTVPDNGAVLPVGEAPAAPASGTAQSGGGGFSGAPRDQGLQGTLEQPNFDAAARERLNAATTATRERAQTYDNGPVGAVLRTNGMQGQYRTMDAAVPGHIFRPGPGGAQAVEAFRRAVGNDQDAIGVLHDYAAASLRRYAERPDGTLDLTRVTAWSRQHRDALRAVPELAEQFGNAARASEAVANFRPLSPEVTAAHVPEAFFTSGPGGFENVQQLRQIIGDDATRTILGDYAASRLRAAAVKPDGTIDPAKFATWRRQNADALRAFPELDAKFANAARASEAIGEAAAARKVALEDYQQGVVGRLIGATEPQDVTRIIGGVFGQKDSAQVLGKIATEAEKDPSARDGLRKAVVDYIADKFISNTEAATSGAGTIKSDQFQTFIRQNAAGLRQVFSEEELQSLRNVAADLKRANRSISAVKLPGGSNTAQDQAAAKVAKAQTIVQYLGASMSGAAGGFMVGGGNPITSMIGFLGGGAVTAARNAGLQKVDDLVKAALLDPQIARALLSKAPNGQVPRGTQMKLIHYFNRLGALTLYEGGNSAGSGPSNGNGTRHSPITLNTPQDVTRGDEVTAEATPAQAEAGNYRKRALQWKGLTLRIENEVGSDRSGVGADGQPWSVAMAHPYGYILGSKGADGDPLDVFVGPHPHSQHTFVIDQIDPATSRFDEGKIIIGARDQNEAEQIYDSSFSDGRGAERRGAITELGVPALKQWIANGDTTQPISKGIERVVTPGKVVAGGSFSFKDILDDERSADELRKVLGLSAGA